MLPGLKGFPYGESIDSLVQNSRRSNHWMVKLQPLYSVPQPLKADVGLHSPEFMKEAEGIT